ncbi:MAG: hypothetical protein IAE78_02235 [Myxococcus sp.]|nr:hypothetical protein [Myxococcus sp.]
MAGANRSSSAVHRVAMVVKGGASTPDGDQANEACAQALRKSQAGLRLVLTEEPLGDVSTLSDAEPAK